MTAIARYGIREQTKAASAVDVHVEEIRILGYTIVDSGFGADRLDDWRNRLDALLEAQAIEAGGRETLVPIGEADTVRAPFAADDTFLAVATEKTLLGIVGALLGEYFILNQQNGIVNPAAHGPHHQSAYHRDLPYQHFVSSRPIALNALLCLDPFTEETGATFALPGSHKVEAFPSDDYVAKMEQTVSAQPGSYILMDSMLYHRAGINRSKGPRRGINNVYTLPIIAQQILLPAMLDGRWSDDPFLAKLLGYEANPARSVQEYRARRFARQAPKRGH